MDKIMEAVTKQALRGQVLRVAEAAEPLGACASVILAAARRKGLAADKDGVAAALNYLEGKGLVRIERVRNDVLGVSMDIAHVTPQGTDALEGTAVIEGIELA